MLTVTSQRRHCRPPRHSRSFPPQASRCAEEDDWFPKVRDDLGRNQLQEIGEELLAAKKNAPTRPSQPSALKKTIDAVLS